MSRIDRPTYEQLIVCGGISDLRGKRISVFLPDVRIPRDELFQDALLMTDYDLELESSRKTLEAAEKAGDISGVLKTSHHMGTVLQKRGDYDGALECYRKALELAESTGKLEEVSRNYYRMGTIHQKRGDYDGRRAIAAAYRRAITR